MSAFCFAIITWQKTHPAELCGGQRSTVCMSREGEGRRELQGAHTILLPAQRECSSLGRVGCTEEGTAPSLGETVSPPSADWDVWEWQGTKNGFLSSLLSSSV